MIKKYFTSEIWEWLKTSQHITLSHQLRNSRLQSLGWSQVCRLNIHWGSGTCFWALSRSVVYPNIAIYEKMLINSDKPLLLVMHPRSSQSVSSFQSSYPVIFMGIPQLYVVCNPFAQWDAPAGCGKKPFLPRQELKQRWQARDPAGMWRFFLPENHHPGNTALFSGDYSGNYGSQWFLYTIWLFNIAMEHHHF